VIETRQTGRTGAAGESFQPSKEEGVEMRSDTVANELGYLVFDEHCGRSDDVEMREHLVDHLVDLEMKMPETAPLGAGPNGQGSA
jgi:hypothetical protein